MSILVDPRIGSGNLLPHLQDMRVPSRHEKLEFGDAAFTGRGPEGRPILVGIEIKAPGDLLHSISTGRFGGHQLPGLVISYELVYLVIEGMPVSRAGKLGFVGRKTYGSWQYDRLIGHLNTYMGRGGLYQWVLTPHRPGTARWLAAHWKWWTSQEWEKHRSHMVLHNIAPKEDPLALYTQDELTRLKLGVAHRLADGVGWERARAAAAHFQSIQEMVNAEAAEWGKIPGFGPKLSGRVAANARRIR
jgi:ERCC4-type nuclease